MEWYHSKARKPGKGQTGDPEATGGARHLVQVPAPRAGVQFAAESDALWCTLVCCWYQGESVRGVNSAGRVLSRRRVAWENGSRSGTHAGARSELHGRACDAPAENGLSREGGLSQQQDTRPGAVCSGLEQTAVTHGGKRGGRGSPQPRPGGLAARETTRRESPQRERPPSRERQKTREPTVPLARLGLSREAGGSRERQGLSRLVSRDNAPSTRVVHPRAHIPQCCAWAT